MENICRRVLYSNVAGLGLLVFKQKSTILLDSGGFYEMFENGFLKE